MKMVRWIGDNILLAFTLFLLAFIPLYPKLPLVGVSHTWVYVRFDDIAIALAVFVYLIQLIRKKAPLKTPLTIAIVLFWLAGLISTVYGILVIFPHLAGVFPHIALLYYLRHIEYLSVFFIAYAAMKEKKDVTPVIAVLIVTVIAVVLYGIGQRFIPHYFPAFSTMNEEFAKGIPLTLSPRGRIQSTFAGHYDLAAYLVMFIPIIGSLIFGFKKWWIKIGLILTGILSVIVLLMTASRTSFAMYLLAIVFMLVIQKQKKWIIPVLIVSLLLLRSFNGIYSRYVSTFQEQTVVYGPDGRPIGLGTTNSEGNIVVDNTQVNTGENLNPGTIALPSNSKATKTTTVVLKEKGGSKSIDITNLNGNFVVKKAQTLDISITTRLQAEWPNAWNAFRRNILLGSGYSAITLATDGNYLRVLGETGLLGFVTFGLIFLIYSVYVYRLLPAVTSPTVRSLILGVTAGIFGLALNAILIDIFEASKIAYVLWLLVGVTLGILHLYQKKTIDIVAEVKRFVTSVPALFTYLFILLFAVFGSMLDNFFVADDFTWLRWIGDCRHLYKGAKACEPWYNTISRFFVQSNDFFYRPLEKVYFYVMYYVAWLNPVLYHLVSLFLHLGSTALVFLVTRRILKNKFFAFVAAAIFLVLGSHEEAIYWISSTQHLFVSFLTLLGLWLFMLYKEKKNSVFLVLSLISVFIAPFFHEFGVIAPFVILLYDTVTDPKPFVKRNFRSLWYYGVFALSLVIYFFLKFISHSYWSAGDYRYNLLKLPLNVVGNTFGYIGYGLIGSPFLAFYDRLRTAGKQQLGLAAVLVLLLVLLLFFLYRYVIVKMKHDERKIILLGIGFFVIPLLPFLGFGNIAPRYVYLASFGLVLLLAYLLQKVSSLRVLRGYPGIILVIVLVLGFSMYQYQQLKLSERDWQKAGKTTNQLLLYLNDIYEQIYPMNKPAFYFTNVPTSIGQAWVFPVGLPDAVWFDYSEKPVPATIASSFAKAKEQAGNNPEAEIFVFRKDGILQRFDYQGNPIQDNE